MERGSRSERKKTKIKGQDTGQTVSGNLFNSSQKPPQRHNLIIKTLLLLTQQLFLAPD